jgi:hypothetical protein
MSGTQRSEGGSENDHRTLEWYLAYENAKHDEDRRKVEELDQFIPDQFLLGRVNEEVHEERNGLNAINQYLTEETDALPPCPQVPDIDVCTKLPPCRTDSTPSTQIDFTDPTVFCALTDFERGKQRDLSLTANSYTNLITLFQYIRALADFIQANPYHQDATERGKTELKWLTFHFGHAVAVSRYVELFDKSNHAWLTDEYLTEYGKMIENLMTNLESSANCLRAVLK